MCCCPGKTMQEKSKITKWLRVWMTSDPEQKPWSHKVTFKLLTDRRKCWVWCSFPSSSNLAHLSMCHLSPSLSLSSSVSPSFTGSVGAQERLSMAQPNRSSQIHNTPSAPSPARGEQPLIFQRTLHYHSGQNTPGISAEALRYHAWHLQNIYTLPQHYIDT